MESTKNNKGKVIFIIITIIITVCAIFTYKKYFKKLEKYTIVNGYVEKTSSVFSYILKDEIEMAVNNTSAATTVVEQYQRVAKNEIIAVYQNDKYKEYINQINKLDSEIEILVNDLPVTYSNEVSMIDEKISEIIKESKNTNSCVKMQEYKVKLDDLSYKRVLLLSDLSPTGSKIRELISKRETLEQENKLNSDSIRAIESGVVSYKIDGLEKGNISSELLNYSIDDLNLLIDSYRTNTSNHFGIKIVDNYDAYMLIKDKKGENDVYLKENKKYRIKVNGSIDYISATLIRHVSDDEYNYCIFNLKNQIELLADQRVLEVEVVWNREEGLAVPTHAIKMSSDGKYSYVTIIKNTEYIDIPVKVVASSDSISIIDNYNNEERESLGIGNSKIKRYDQIVLGR